MKHISEKDRVYLQKNQHRISNKKSIVDIVTERRIKAYGTTSENAMIVHDVSSSEAILKAGNHMAEYGNYPVGMKPCFVVGLNGGCGIECPVFKEGSCESTDGFPRDKLIEFGYIEE